MPNTINYATVFQRALDKQFAVESVTGWMDQNADMAKYSGGAEIKIPTIIMDGLADYDRQNGYKTGGANLTYQTMKMTMDRGRGFDLDAMDVDESNFVANASTLMGLFQRDHVVPEVDAYRLSTLASKAEASMKKTYTPAAASVFGQLLDDLAAVQDVVGFNTPLVIHMSSKAHALLAKSTEFTRRIDIADFDRGEIKTKVKTLDNTPIIPTMSGLMMSAYNFWKGAEDKTDAESSAVLDKAAGGFDAKTDAKQINWIIVPKDAPIAVCKQDLVRTFDPTTWQKANAWHTDYRKYHDLWVTNAKAKGIFVNIGS